MSEIKVEWDRNVDNLIKAMDELSRKDYEKIMRTIHQTLAKKHIVDRLKQSLPYSARSKKGIRVTSGSRYDKTAVAAGPTSDVYWLRFVEGGTKERRGRGSIAPQNRIGPILDAQIEPIVEEWSEDIWDVIEASLKMIK